MKLKKYRVNARIVTKSISGYVMATNGEEAIQKFLDRNGIQEYHEEYDCETIEENAEEIK